MEKKDWLVLVLFLLITLAFFHKVLFGLVPIPMDILTGAYFPWLDYKWGFLTGVPVKNPAISDVFSTFYPWRELAVSIVQQGQIPLWNPYSLSGAPLLANWQTTILYPLNIFMFILGTLRGWTIMIVLQPLLSMVFMYFYLRTLEIRRQYSVFGAVVFAFSGFMMIFLEVTFAQAGIWLPLLLLAIDNYLKKNKIIWLIVVSLTLFLNLTAGNFQISLYLLILSVIYLIARSLNLYGKGRKSIKLILYSSIYYILGLGLAAIQLVPMTELFLKSIRQADSNIIQYNFGLLPLKNIITFFAPDFYGNPTTGNFRGFLYHETSGYFGILALVLIILAFFKRRDFITYFFGFSFLISLLLIFDTFLGRFLFEIKAPLISTSYASRALFITGFSAAVLAAQGLEALQNNRQFFIKIATNILGGLVGIILGLVVSIMVMKYFGVSNSFKELIDLNISLRNIFLPTLLLLILIVFLKLKFRNSVIVGVLLLLTIIDMFRFGLKYNPFVPAGLVYPQTPALEYLQKNSGFYRIEREKTEVLPPNSWIPYRLSSPSGYDPLYSQQYASFFNVYNNTSPEGGSSRYAELDNYQSPFIDLAGVKYFLVVKRDKNNVIDKRTDTISYKITDPKYKKVFEDGTSIVLENTQVMSRVVLFDSFDVEDDYQKALNKLYLGYDFRNKVILNEDPQAGDLKKEASDKVEITSYAPNKVKLNSQTIHQAIVMLTDSSSPGWKVTVDGKLSKLFLADGIYRAVVVPSGFHEVEFNYNPDSFKYGVLISAVSLIFLLVGAFIFLKNKL